MKRSYSEYITGADERWREFQQFQKLGLIPRHGDFSPAGVHYPPITNYPPIEQDLAYKGFEETEKGKFDVYVGRFS